MPRRRTRVGVQHAKKDLPDHIWGQRLYVSIGCGRRGFMSKHRDQLARFGEDGELGRERMRHARRGEVIRRHSRRIR